MFTYRHKLISLIVLVAVASLLSLADKVIRGLEYDYTTGRMFLSTLTILYIGGSALYYLSKERHKYAYVLISIYYLALIVATFAALYSVARTDGVNQFVISTSFYLNHISRTYLFAYWFVVFTTFFTICSVVILILSTSLLLDLRNRERAFSSLSNSDLIKEFCRCARRYWQYYGSKEKEQMELGAKALLEARWGQYELNRRNIRHGGLFEACRSSDSERYRRMEGVKKPGRAVRMGRCLGGASNVGKALSVLEIILEGQH